MAVVKAEHCFPNLVICTCITKTQFFSLSITSKLLDLLGWDGVTNLNGNVVDGYNLLNF